MQLYPDDVREALANGLVEGVLSATKLPEFSIKRSSKSTAQEQKQKPRRQFSYQDLRMHYLYSKTIIIGLAFSWPLWVVPIPGLQPFFRFVLFAYTTLYQLISAWLYR